MLSGGPYGPQSKDPDIAEHSSLRFARIHAGMPVGIPRLRLRLRPEWQRERFRSGWRRI